MSCRCDAVTLDEVVPEHDHPTLYGDAAAERSNPRDVAIGDRLGVVDRNTADRPGGFRGRPASMMSREDGRLSRRRWRESENGHRLLGPFCRTSAARRLPRGSTHLPASVTGSSGNRRPPTSKVLAGAMKLELIGYHAEALARTRLPRIQTCKSSSSFASCCVPRSKAVRTCRPPRRQRLATS